jgi:hypothetical protein
MTFFSHEGWLEFLGMLGRKLRARLASPDKYTRLGMLAWVTMALKRRPWLKAVTIDELKIALRGESDPDVLSFLEDIVQDRASTNDDRHFKDNRIETNKIVGLGETSIPLQFQPNRKMALLSYARRDNTFHKDAITTMGDIIK